MKRRTILGLGLAAIVAVILYYVYGGSAVPAGQPPLERLSESNFGELRDAFNSSKDSVRLVTLLSPT